MHCATARKKKNTQTMTKISKMVLGRKLEVDTQPNLMVIILLDSLDPRESNKNNNH